MDAEPMFSSTEVLRVLPHVTYRRLDYWDRTDVVKPTGAAANGSGTQRLYTLEDALTVALVAAVSDAGAGLPVEARRVIEGGAEIAVARIEPGARDHRRQRTEIVGVSSLGDLRDILRGGPATFVDVARIREDVTERLLALRPVAA